MNLQSQPNDLSQLRYGLRAKIFKNGIFSLATLYLDNLYNHFLWVTTENNAFLIDLCFTTISCYSLQLQLALKYQSGFKGEYLPKYILLRQFNLEVPILFEQFQCAQFSSEKNIQNFIEGRKPHLYSVMENLLQSQRSQCRYSSSFSRFFKKMRLQLQNTQTSHPSIFTTVQVNTIFSFIGQLSSAQKSTFIGKQEKLGPTKLFQILKIIYCRMNLNILKTTNASQSISNFKRPESFLDQRVIELPGQGQKFSCFQALVRLQDGGQNYIIPQHKVREDLPLIDYFCFSSHNTYLTGNQLTSDCKITRYIEDLKKGIKCVQLDVHNQGNNQPIITHGIKGKGFCKPISFRKTIEAMDQFLEYHPSHFPIILSIENHANRQNQDLMNNILSRQFPKCIVTPKQREQFYLLSQIKGKIIIKTSCDFSSLIQFKNNHQAPKIKSYDKQFSNRVSGIGHNSNTQIGPNQQCDQFSCSQAYNSNLENNQFVDDDMIQPQNADYEKFIQKINKIKKLKQLFNQKIDQNSYLPIQKIVQITCIFKAPKGIQTAKPSPFECCSMQNGKIVKTLRQKITNYTKQAWLRSYPQGTQIYSNNYDFLELLHRGVQIIALNTQTNDDYAIMMNSYFRAGRLRDMEQIGYVQKPVYLRKSNQKIMAYPFTKRYTFTFFTSYNLQFRLYSIDNAKIEETHISGAQKISFKLNYFNQSFLIIRIDKQWIQCLPLRFLGQDRKSVKKGEQVTRNIIGRDYQFQDTGVRVLCRYRVDY